MVDDSWNSCAAEWTLTQILTKFWVGLVSKIALPNFHHRISNCWILKYIWSKIAYILSLTGNSKIMHRGILLLIQSWFWQIYLALYEQPGRYISNVRDRFVVREISGYRQRVIGSWMQDGYLKSSKVWLIQGFRCVLPLISKTLFPWDKSHVHLLSRYPVILSGKPWCYLVFYFK